MCAPWPLPIRLCQPVTARLSMPLLSSRLSECMSVDLSVSVSSSLSLSLSVSLSLSESALPLGGSGQLEHSGEKTIVF